MGTSALAWGQSQSHNTENKSYPVPFSQLLALHLLFSSLIHPETEAHV